ncbi:MAG: HD domain-containing protein [SAR86 cluster bacterium]|jgi:predicted HD phosphohydrolase|nr:HD domain-containing protein [SAR86 cluster bacterium]
MKNNNLLKQATFSSMTDGTSEDYTIIAEHAIDHASKLPDRVLEHLSILEGDTGGFAIDRLAHSLQTATRAYRDGKDEEYVVCALLHDIGDTLASANHADLAATMLKPFISDKNYWIVKHHGIFQGYYFFNYLGLDKNLRDEFKGHEYWNDCAEFCAKYDQNSFDPDYDNMSLDEFKPMVQKVFSKPKESIYKKRDY